VIRVRVTVPASSGNVGPGFDVLGLALAIYNRVELTCSTPRRFRSEGEADRALREVIPLIEISGEGAESLPRDASNLAFRSLAATFARLRMAPGFVAMRMDNGIPLTRGLGSSAATTVAGILAASAACGSSLCPDHALRIATEFEGHADNAAAQLMGGLTACMTTPEGTQAVRLPLKDRYDAVLAIPDYELKTRDARKVVPGQVPLADVIYSMSRTVILAGLLAQGAQEGIAEAMKDRIHQPHRASLMPGFNETLHEAVKAGALGAALSGAGPTILALVPKSDAARATRVGNAMLKALSRAGVKARSQVACIDKRGARVSIIP
jgi:homoserine kinase